MRFFSTKRWYIPIRFKMIGLLFGSLAASLVIYSYFGNEIIYEDKISYVYDYNLNTVQSIANKLEKQFNQIDLALRHVSSLKRKSKSINDETQQKLSKQYGIVQIEWTPYIDIKNQKVILPHGWSTETYKDGNYSVGYQSFSVIEMTNLALNFDGTPVVYRAQVRLDAKMMESIDSLNGYLFDSKHQLLQKSEKSSKIDIEKLRGLFKFETGVQDWKDQTAEYILGYHFFHNSELVVAGLMPKSVAFKAADDLITRTIALGLSILALGLGLTFLFARKITEGLMELSDATQRVASGDFTSQLDIDHLGRDEIAMLGSSFNVMSEKIESLMEETAIKARMEKELETAQTVQSRYFPSEDYLQDGIQISGLYKPASECAGDWWYYEKVKNSVVIAIADVTGHGAPAAMVTAATHSVFKIVMNQLKKNPDLQPDLGEIVHQLHLAVKSAASDEASMTLLIGVLDLSTKKFSFYNAGHRPPMLLNPGSQKVKSIVDGKIDSLGTAKFGFTDEPPAEIELGAGDYLMFYTDGLIECENSEGKPLSKRDVQRLFRTGRRSLDVSASEVCQYVMDETLTHIEADTKELDDDISLLILNLEATSSLNN